jgi:hypothetical protein
MLSVATLDQTYVHMVDRDGNSVIEKTADLGLLSTELNPGAFERMAEVCSESAEFDCTVDVENKVVVLNDNLQSGGYYTYEVDYGFPFTTNTLTINSIPTDRFSRLLDRLFANADATNAPGTMASPLYLKDKEENQEGAALLKNIGITITYTIEMPVGISEASAGEVVATIDGNRASFDFVEVLAVSEPMVVKSSDINYSYLVAVAGIVILVWLGWSFIRSQPKPKKSKKKK